MKCTLMALSMIAAAATHLAAQRVDLSSAQVHGFATQSFLYTTHNNWAATKSSDGSAAWTEAVVNLTRQPESKLRIRVQARYFVLCDHGNKITLDWAQADYKVNEEPEAKFRFTVQARHFCWTTTAMRANWTGLRPTIKSMSTSNPLLA